MKTTSSTILRYMRPYSLLIILAVVAALGKVAVNVFVPLQIGSAIDAISEGLPITSYLIRMGIAAVIGAISLWLINTLGHFASAGLIRDIRRDAFARIQSMPMKEIDSRQRGELVNRVIVDTDGFADGVVAVAPGFFTGIFSIVAIISMLFVLRWQIAAIIVVLTPISLIIARFIAGQTHKMFILRSKKQAAHTGFAVEQVENIKLVQAFGQQEAAIKRFNALDQELRKASKRAIFASAITPPTTRFVNSIVYAIVTLVGAFVVIATADAADPFTVGMLVSALALAVQFSRPFNEISSVMTELGGAVACAGRVFEIINAPTTENSGADCPTFVGEISVRNLSFSYNGVKPVLSDVNFTLAPGEHGAIIGPTGGGKTTLINLIMRHYQPPRDTIFIDGTDILDIDIAHLRRSIGMVPQQPWIRVGTVRDNIRLSRESASDQDVIAAARAAHAHDFISRLPKGYDTMLYSDGDTLSAGQLQLICIARTILAAPEMLILDEAVSSVDHDTEVKIQKAIATLMQGRTSIVIAHRPTFVESADKVIKIGVS